MPSPTPLSLLTSSVLGQRRRNIIALVAATGHQAGEALVPVVVGLAIDRAVLTGDGAALLGWVGVLAAAFVMLSFSYAIYDRVATRASVEATLELRMRSARHALDPRASSEHAAGGRATVITTDVASVAAVNNAIFLVAAGLGGLAVAAFSLLRIDTVLGLVVVLGAIPLVVLLQVVATPLERRITEERTRAAVASDIAADLLTGLRVIKGLGAESTAAERFRTTSRTALSSTMSSARLAAVFDGVAVLATGIFVAVVAVVAGLMALRGEISVGSLVAALGLAQFLTGPLTMLAATAGVVAECRSSARRVAALLAIEAPTHGSRLPDHTQMATLVIGECAVGQVGASIDVPGGSLIGIAAGQSVLDRIAAALTGDVTDPTTLLDGHPLTAYEVEELRRRVLVAPHIAQLFTGTVGDNLAAAARDDRAVDQAIRAACVDDILAGLPGGRAGEVGENGHKLSGGQRQRVALARALAADPAALVLHEPTSAVDSVTETRVADAVRELRAGRRTTVLLTCSPVLLSRCDSVAWVGFDDVAVAPHARLVARMDYARAVLR